MTLRRLSRQWPALNLPLSDAAVWTFGLGLMLLVFVLDLCTPSAVVLGTVLSASVAFGALGRSRRVVWQLVALAIGANLLAGLWNAQRDGADWAEVTNRAVSILTVVLVGLLSLRARDASERSARLREEETQLERERALRQLAEDMGGPLGQAEFVERAARALLRLSRASSVEVGAVEKATLRAPHALALAPDLSPEVRPSRLNARVPLEFLARPAQIADTWATDAWAADAWVAQGHSVVLARLRRPTGGDLLVLLTAPRAPTALIADAARALQPLLERTALLDDLRENRQQLAERGEVLRDLVYAFSHDLRTPLVANAMNMQAALRGAYGPLPTEYQATLHNGLDANETLLALADQLLLVARFESGETQQEDAVTVNLRELVLSVLADLRPRAEARGLTLDTELSGVSVPGHRHELRRAAQNLIDNAIKFSPPGGTVRVSLSSDGSDAALSVQDDGAGVSAARQARLFQRFRGGGAGSGTGLGLYLTRRIAEAHGGSVHYTRTGSARSVFTLNLPLQSGHD